MSLTSELRNSKSPIGLFFRETFPDTRQVLTECRQALGDSTILLLRNKPHRASYGQIGTAIDYRIRYHFAHTPFRQLVAAQGALAVALPDQIPADLPPDRLGALRDFALGPACVSGFIEFLEPAVEMIAPDRVCPTDGEERLLANLCLVLAAFEAVSRALSWPPPYFGKTAPRTVEELLVAVPDDWVTDAAALGSAFSIQYDAWRGTDAALNPTFAGSKDVGGGDADLIVDGCLWDIKTTTQHVRSIYIYQILGYAFLDYSDEFAIQRVGLLFPRQGAQVSWQLGELIARLSGRGDLDVRDLRKRFRHIAENLGYRERAAP